MTDNTIRNNLEEKYNIKLDLSTKIGEETYWELREYFTKEIELDNLIIPTDSAHMCCHRTNIELIEADFDKAMKEFRVNDPGPCDDPWGVGCSTVENNPIQESIEPYPPPYND